MVRKEYLEQLTRVIKDLEQRRDDIDFTIRILKDLQNKLVEQALEEHARGKYK